YKETVRPSRVRDDEVVTIVEAHVLDRVVERTLDRLDAPDVVRAELLVPLDDGLVRRGALEVGVDRRAVEGSGIHDRVGSEHTAPRTDAARGVHLVLERRRDVVFGEITALEVPAARIGRIVGRRIPGADPGPVDVRDEVLVGPVARAVEPRVDDS